MPKNKRFMKQLILDVDGLAFIIALAYPGVGFAVSTEYPGKTAYDKVKFDNPKQKPKLEDIIKMADRHGYAAITPEEYAEQLAAEADESDEEESDEA